MSERYESWPAPFLASRISHGTVCWTGLSGKHQSGQEKEKVKVGGESRCDSMPHLNLQGFEVPRADLLGPEMTLGCLILY